METTTDVTAASSAPTVSTSPEERFYGPEADSTPATTETVKPEAESATAKSSEAAAVDSTAAKPDSVSETEQEKQEPLTPKQEKRIRELVRQNKELAARLEAQERTRTQQTQPSQEVPKQTISGDKGPRLADFTTIEEYEEARDAYARKIAEAQARTVFETARQEQARLAEEAAKKEQWEANVQKWRDRESSYAKAHPDYTQMVYQDGLLTVRLNSHLDQALLTEEHAPEILHFLAKNPAEAERIAGLSERDSLREMYKIAFQLQAQVPPDKSTKAPKPPSTVSGTGASPRKTTMEQRFYGD